MLDNDEFNDVAVYILWILKRKLKKIKYYWNLKIFLEPTVWFHVLFPDVHAVRIFDVVFVLHTSSLLFLLNYVEF